MGFLDAASMLLSKAVRKDFDESKYLYAEDQQPNFAQTFLNAFNPISRAYDESRMVGSSLKIPYNFLIAPRPWELNPISSVAYNMASGSGPISEKATTGLRQFAGRYVTNIKEPAGYIYDPTIKKNDDIIIKKRIPEMAEYIANTIGAIGSDKPEWASRKTLQDRDVLYRDMFDMPARTQLDSLKKMGDKKYYYNMTQEQVPIWSARKDDQPVLRKDPIMGQFVLTPHSHGWKFSDTWDIVTSRTKEGNTAYGESDLNERIRKIVAPFLRPSTIYGAIATQQLDPNDPNTDL